jgi:hypothetical protein
MNGGLLSALDYIDYEDIERGAAGFEYLGMQQEADTLRTALELAFPDGPVPAEEREDHTLGLPRPVLERIEGELEDAFDVEDAMYDAFVHAYRDRSADFAPV